MCFTVKLFAQNNQVLQLLPKNPHYFMYQNKPTVIVGSGEHYGAVLNLDFNYDVYLKTLQNDGLNITRLFVGAYYEKPGAFGIERNTLAPNEGSLVLPWKKINEKYDLSKWNESYFERLHDFIKKAGQAGIFVEITLFSSYYNNGWPYHPFNGLNNINQIPTNIPFDKVNTLENSSILKFQEIYVRKMVRELNQYNHIYFEIQNEPWADKSDTVLILNDYISKEELKEDWNDWKNTLQVPSKTSAKWHQVVSGWIVEEEELLGKKHLISHNIANFKFPVSVTDPNISIYNFHYAHPDAVSLNYGINKAIGFNETGFSGRKNDTYRRQAWRFMMSGGGLFGHLDLSFSVGHEDGSDVENKAPGGGGPILRKQLNILKNYLQGLNLSTLKPDKTFLGHVQGAFTFSMKDALSRVIYIEPILPEPAKINLIIPVGKYLIEWTDVITGEKIKTGKMKFSQTQMQLVSPEGVNDKIVKLTKL